MRCCIKRKRHTLCRYGEQWCLSIKSMKHKVDGIVVTMKPNLVGCASHPCNDPLNWWPSQNLSAEDNNSTEFGWVFTINSEEGFKMRFISTQIFKRLIAQKHLFCITGSRRRMNVLIKTDAPHLEG